MKDIEDNTKRVSSEEKRKDDTDHIVQKIPNLPKDRTRQTERAGERTFEDTLEIT